MHDEVNSTRRELLTALAIAMAAPLVGCGGGVSPSGTAQGGPAHRPSIEHRLRQQRRYPAIRHFLPIRPPAAVSPPTTPFWATRDPQPCVSMVRRVAQQYHATRGLVSAITLVSADDADADTLSPRCSNWPSASAWPRLHWRPALFIPDRLRANASQLIDGIHLALFALAALTIASTLIFVRLRAQDGDSVSRHCSEIPTG